jgi:hypothetical protein
MTSRRKNGRAKGKTGEREAAKLLAAWWAPVEPDTKFVSTPQSGGWSTPAIRAAYKAAGDLMTTSELWPFSVEVKRREGWKWSRLLGGLQHPAWDWWEQCTAAAREENRTPLLMFRKNNQPWCIGVDARKLGAQLAALGHAPLVVTMAGELAIFRYDVLETVGAGTVLYLTAA